MKDSYLYRKLYNFAHCAFSKYMSVKASVYGYPDRVRLEACTLCQLNCPTCYMREHDYCGRGAGYLKFADFKNFVDRHKHIRQIELANSGEIFLNPELLSIMEYANKKNVKLTANGGTNFNNVQPDVLDGLVKYKVKSISISMDGASQETYSKYRVKGNIDKVWENVKIINGHKKERNSKYPKLRWQYILMQHNQGEVEEAIKKASELNLEIRFKLDWNDGFNANDPEKLKKLTGLKYFTRADYAKATGHMYKREICNQLWNNPQINFDGMLVGCCVEPKDDYGINVFEVGLKEALNHESYVYSKKMLMGKVPVDHCNPCAKCPNGHFQWIIEHGDFVRF